MNKPFFSIVIPTYEMSGMGTKFLEESFKKLSIQNFKDFDVVISDHSINDLIKLLCEKWSTILNIKYYKNVNNVGSSSSNLNNGIDKCSGCWIKILFQDDFLLNENSLSILKSKIDENVLNYWFVSSCEHTNDGTNLYRPFRPSWNDNIHLGINTISSPSVITFKNNSNKIYFDGGLLWLMDVDFYKRIYNEYGLPYFIQDILVVNRTWGESLSNTLSEEIKNNEINLMLLKYAN
jgi:hypothetical protein